MGSERRTFDRVPIPMSLRFRSRGGFMGMWLDGVLQDLSASGLRFTTLQPVEVGAILEFTITLPDRVEPYLLTGQALWVDASKPDELQYGVIFVELTDRQHIFLDELVKFLKARRG